MVATGLIDERRATATSRITGIDLARAIAMLGMIIAHFAWPDGSGTWIDLMATAVRGRAMPLFVLLGGVGVTILTARSANPDRALLIRAAILFPLGVALQEATLFLAIILQFYALFFLLAIVARRLQTSVLVAVAAAVAIIGPWTYQVLVVDLERWTEPAQVISDPDVVVQSLLFSGYYPFFPVGSFFLLGMAIGRLDLRSRSNAIGLGVGGAVVGFATLVVSRLAVALFGIDRLIFESPPDDFSFARLLDTEGHSQMLAWVISAGGTSLAVLGAALLIAPRIGGFGWPLVALGQLALSFYVFQAVLTRVTPHPRDTELPQELLTALVIYIGFAAFAVGWKRFFRVGPLEMLFRIGSRSRRPAALRNNLP